MHRYAEKCPERHLLTDDDGWGDFRLVARKSQMIIGQRVPDTEECCKITDEGIK